MNAEDIIARVVATKSRRELPDTVRDLSAANPILLFDTLFPIAASKQCKENGPVAYSAVALHAANPPCSITCDEALSMMVEREWDISIEEVPWYLANEFGVESVLKSVQEMGVKTIDEDAQVRLKTVRYWVGLNPPAG